MKETTKREKQTTRQQPAEAADQIQSSAEVKDIPGPRGSVAKWLYPDELGYTSIIEDDFGSIGIGMPAASPKMCVRGKDGGPSYPGVDGVCAYGSDSDNYDGGNGLLGAGGTGSIGGAGVVAFGGYSTGSLKIGGTGLYAAAGASDLGGGVISGIAGQFLGSVSIQKVSGYNGNLFVGGNLSVAGTYPRFTLDHPLDPENKYLYHAAIASSETLNLYSGHVTTDENGEAAVQLPDWFEAVNQDFRYQLTVIGSFARAMVASEIKENRFTIKTDAANVKVSWQVTGVRADAVMTKRPFMLEEDKPEAERGTYLNPDAYDQPEEKGIAWAQHPDLMRQIHEQAKAAQRKSQK
jgi:hypothetical protein